MFLQTTATAKVGQDQLVGHESRPTYSGKSEDQLVGQKPDQLTLVVQRTNWLVRNPDQLTLVNQRTNWLVRNPDQPTLVGQRWCRRFGRLFGCWWNVVCIRKACTRADGECTFPTNPISCVVRCHCACASGAIFLTKVNVTLSIPLSCSFA